AAVGAGFVTSVRTASDLRRLVTTKDFVTLTDAVPSVESALLRAAGAVESGNRRGPPGKAVRPTGRTCSYGREGQLAVRVGRLGRPQSPTKGEAGGNRDSRERLLGALGPRGRRWLPASAGDEPEVSRATLFWSAHEAEGPSLYCGRGTPTAPSVLRPGGRPVT